MNDYLLNAMEHVADEILVPENFDENDEEIREELLKIANRFFEIIDMY
jgi:hypothetical protein